jgi:very-short-patch-repair endonuclease
VSVSLGPIKTKLAVERAKQVFRFLKAFAERDVPVRTRIGDHRWCQRLCELPEHPSIVVGEVHVGAESDVVDGENTVDLPLITVKRPTLTPPPEPPDSIVDFLRPGWRDPDGTTEVLESRKVVKNGVTETERFTEARGRIDELAKWRTAWVAWAVAERPARQAMRVFESFYDLKGHIDRESQKVELLLGDGRLRWESDGGDIDHPILLQRVDLIFDADVPEFRVVDTDREPEFYGSLFQGDGVVSPQQINALRMEVERGGYHPLSRDGATNGFFRRVVQTISPQGQFEDVAPPIDGPIDAKPVIVRDAFLFLRERSSGYPAAFDRVLEDLEQRGEVPTALSRLVGVETIVPPQVDTGEWSPWGEPPDVLLSKPANDEQIAIARALERHNAVLVQGPPGTGKSHTIANLVGHLVANGKRVLVTSHTTKALRVLRGQIVSTLQPLCVALLDNDLEGRTQMEEAVKGILARLTSADENVLERELMSLSDTRAELNRDIGEVTAKLRLAREAEYRPIPIGGESLQPSEATRWVNDHQCGNDWIPGLVEPGAALPLSADDVRELYETNGQVSAEEESEIDHGLPTIDAVPEPDSFTVLVEALDAVEPTRFSPFWEQTPAEPDLAGLEDLSALATAASDHLSRVEHWQRQLIEIGRQSSADTELWKQLPALVDEAHQRLERAKPLVLEHDPQLPPEMSADQALRISSDIENHMQSGGSLGGMTLAFHGEWKAFLRSARCNDRVPSSLDEFRALRARAQLVSARAKLAMRWKRQAEPIGLPAFDSFEGDPELALRDYSRQFEGLLGWWNETWPRIAGAAAAAGFRWAQFRDQEIARSQPLSPFERDVQILSGPMLEALDRRIAACRRAAALRRLNQLENTLRQFGGARPTALASAVSHRDVWGYALARDALELLVDKIPIVERRRALLDALSPVAAEWSRAIETRQSGHAEAIPGPDATMAWRWRQLQQEVERRAALDEVQLTAKLNRLREDLRGVTTKLIDRRAWLGQMRRIDLEARQALQGWAQTQKRIGKGTGKRVPELQSQARKLLGQARDAVPVWIMPLARVAESFDATRGKFDVVIIDEASQSDVTGLLAWYLGDRVAVVGDHEQVSPLAVGQHVDSVADLISQHLIGVPNSHLYDGKLSVYDLARQSFGGTIALREHFRCVSDIIDFSNHLSYNGDIRPLRDPTRVSRPHVIEHLVDSGSRSNGDKRNLEEARRVVAIMAALVERAEYAGASMGAISLLGDEQAFLIHELARRVLGAVTLERHHFAAGNAAQFQGDERDVMFLSMVDSPNGGVLRLRQDDTLKQRYNVAASRAKNQLWLVHSLDPSRDLHSTDLRRRLIEHVRAPSARRAIIQSAQSRAESALERSVLQRLIAAGYRATPQLWVGQYRIDIVVSDESGQVALECDGDRTHGVEHIPEDMARQSVLERAGWRFIRVRGTRFYRDPDSTMDWVFGELRRLGVRPGLEGDPPQLSGYVEFHDAVMRRAWDIMREQEWIRSEDPVAVRPDRVIPAVRSEKASSNGVY